MRALLLLACGVLINSLGTGMTAFALAVYSYRRQGSATAVALVQLCAFAPLILLAPLAGVLADRFDRRTMMVAGDGGSVLGLGVVVLALHTRLPHGMILFGVALSSCLAALTEPALRASVTELVPLDDQVRASGVLQLASAAKFLIAPALAGLLMAHLPVSAIVLIDIATCLVTVSITAAVQRIVGRRAACPEPADWRTRFSRGIAVVFGSRTIRRLVLVMVLITCALGTVQTLIKPILLPLTTPQGAGTCETVAALGLVVGSALLQALARQDPARLLGVGLLLVGLTMTLLGLVGSPIWLTGWAFAMFATLPMCNAGAETLVRRAVPGHVQARAWGVISLITQLGYLLAFGCAGPIADRLLAPAMAPGGIWHTPLAGWFGTDPGRNCALLVLAMGVVVMAASPAIRFLPPSHVPDESALRQPPRSGPRPGPTEQPTPPAGPR